MGIPYPTHMTYDSPHQAFVHATQQLGGQSAMARLTGKHQTIVRERLVKGQPLWAEHVLAVESATGVSRHDLRPDIYPRDLAPAPDAGATDQTEAA
jgi:DNA-binding transcriptional regulator YdaS (Cro superfamily)